MVGDVVGLQIDVEKTVAPRQFTINFCVRVEAIHALLPSKRPRSRQFADDSVVDAERDFVAQIFERIKRTIDGLGCGMALVDIGVADFDIGDKRVAAEDLPEVGRGVD